MKTPITYYGGKQTMLKYIRPLIPAHTIYCEPFAGGAPVFFDKEPAKVNVINDLNSELINFYRVIVTRPDDFKKEVLQTLHSRGQHSHAGYIYSHAGYFTDVQRAWAIWMLSKSSFNLFLVEIYIDIRNRVSSMSEGGSNGFFGYFKRCGYCRPCMPGVVGSQLGK
ncbi:MAG: DNA adenine methylase [Dysgonomonas sp.]